MKITESSASALNEPQDRVGNRKGLEPTNALPQAAISVDRYTPSSPESASDALGLDTVSLSGVPPAGGSEEALTPRLAALKQAISDGTYQVSTSALADAMIKKAFVESTPESFTNTGNWLT